MSQAPTIVLGPLLPDSFDSAPTYQGDLLAGVAVSEPGFEEWLLPERERLREMAMDALAKLLMHQRSAGACEAAVQTGLRLLGLDPLQESVHRTLMRLYVELGRRPAAVRQYQQCVAALRRELSVEPEDETKLLYQQLRRGRPSETGLAPTSLPRGHSRSGRKGAAARLDLPNRETPLIGREAETARLHAGLDEALRGHGNVMVVIGEAGIGKTSLLGVLAADAVRQGARVLIGRSHESDQILPFGPWVDAFSHGQVVQDGALLRGLKPVWLAELGRLLGELDTAGLPAPSGSDRRLFESVAQLVEQLAEQQPLVLILEDLHWADEMSLRLLSFISRRIAAWRALLLTTAREEELADAPVTRRSIQEWSREAQTAVVSLAPLSRPEIVRLIQSLGWIGADTAATERLEKQVWAVSEGNPFVAVETMRAVQEGAALQDSTMHLTQRVRDLVAGRLDRLSEQARQLAAVAAVFGREFDVVLPQTAARFDECVTAAGVEELVRRRIFHEVGERFDFTHDRIRAVVYSQLLLPQRRLLHRRAGEALEVLSARSPEPHALAIGSHYRQGEDWQKAVTFLARAGAAAVAQSAYSDAVRCYEQALAAAANLPTDRDGSASAIDLRLDLASAYVALGDLPRLLATLEEAETLARALRDEHRAGRTWSWMAQYFRLVGDPERAVDVGNRALTVARAHGYLALERDVNYRLGQAYRSLGDFRQAVVVLERNITMIEELETSSELARRAEEAVLCRTQLAIAYSELGEIRRGLVTAERGLRLAESVERPDLIASSLCALGVVRLEEGELDGAIAAFEECCRLALRWDLRVLRFWAEAPLGHAYALTGRVEEAVTVLERVALESAFLPHSRAGRLNALAKAYILRGQPDVARGTAGEALALARRHHEQGHEARSLLLLADLDARTPPVDIPATFQRYESAMELAADLGMRPLVAHCHLQAGRLYRRAGHGERAETHFSVAATMFREMQVKRWLEEVDLELTARRA